MAQYLCIWVRAYWFSATLISKWPPGGHIGFFFLRTLTLVWLRMSTPNFSGTVLMYMGRSLLIFIGVNFKIAAWQPYLSFWFPDSNFSLALNMNSKLQWLNTCVYELEPIDFQLPHFLNGCLVAILDFLGFWTVGDMVSAALEFQFQISCACPLWL